MATTPTRPIRIPHSDWVDLLALTKEMETDCSAVVRDFVRWYLRRHGQKLPPRPSLEQAREREKALERKPTVHASESTPGDVESP